MRTQQTTKGEICACCSRPWEPCSLWSAEIQFARQHHHHHHSHRHGSWFFRCECGILSCSPYFFTVLPIKQEGASVKSIASGGTRLCHFDVESDQIPRITELNPPIPNHSGWIEEREEKATCKHLNLTAALQTGYWELRRCSESCRPGRITATIHGKELAFLQRVNGPINRSSDRGKSRAVSQLWIRSLSPILALSQIFPAGFHLPMLD